jgi:hypothetical protein
MKNLTPQEALNIIPSENPWLDMTTNIFGPKYIKPEEGFMRYTSSENCILKIQKIVRNGKEIL